MLDTPTIQQGGTIIVDPPETMTWAEICAAMTYYGKRVATLDFGPYPLGEMRLELVDAV